LMLTVRCRILFCTTCPAAVVWVRVWDWLGNLQQDGRYAASKCLLLPCLQYEHCEIGFGYQLRFQFAVVVQ
jgi:hypothetical protein